MTFHSTNRRRALIIAAGLTLAAAAARADGTSSYRGLERGTFQRFSLSVDGGFGPADGNRGLFDAKTELQFGLSRRIRIGLGVGYLSSGSGWGGRGRRAPEDASMAEMNGESQDRNFREFGSGNGVRAIPVSLNAYYTLPVGRRLSLFAGGGASFYWATFRGVDFRERKTAWGGQGGLGVEYRLGRRLTLLAQGEYRFADFGKRPNAAADLSTEAATDPHDMDKGGFGYPHLNVNGVGFHLGVKIGL
jgi:opacity protein-like surface antigen